MGRLVSLEAGCLVFCHMVVYGSQHSKRYFSRGAAVSAQAICEQWKGQRGRTIMIDM